MIGRWLFAVFWVGAVSLAGAGAGGCSHAESGTTSGGAHADDRVYVCPMHCVQPGHSEPYSQHGPGQCPVCGMNLVVKRDEQAPPSGGAGH